AANASAALTHPINGTPAGDGNVYGSLILNVWNGTNRYTRDLGSINTWLSNPSTGTTPTLTPFQASSHTFFDGGASNSTTSLFDTLSGTAGITGWNVMAAFTDQTNANFNGVATTGNAATTFANGNQVENAIVANGNLVGNLNALGGQPNANGEYNATS